MAWIERNRSLFRTLATLLPVGAAAMMYGLRDLITPTAAALVLVLIVVGIAATGDRVAGLLSCLAGAAGFDFFLTTPYLDFHVENRGDVRPLVADKFLMGLIAHGDDQSGEPFVRGELAGLGADQLNAGSASGGNRARVHPFSGMGAR